VPEVIERFESAAAIADAVAVGIRDLAISSETLSVGLTGGTLGVAVAAALSQLDDLPTDRLHCLFGDERYVALDDAERNEAQVLSVWPTLKNTSLLRYPDPAQFDSLEAARDVFEQQLRATNLASGFDVLILGVGPDGHVASLFPGHNRSGELVIAEAESPKPPAQRLSLSYELLNRAKRVWFVAAGAAKSDAIRSGLGQNVELPVARVKGLVETRWFIDGEIVESLG
jgi:6-phosphogluconolactonase